MYRRLLIQSFFPLLILAFAGNSLAKQVINSEAKPASIHTQRIIKGLRETLPFNDRRDFEEQSKGFIAKPNYLQIMADAGHVAWDMARFDFLLSGKEFNSIHPSLQRQALLNMNYGLYEVVPGIYQVRGFDLANISFIKGDTGWIVFDVLTSKETARAALAFINSQLGERPVVAVIYSHTHADHFGGVRGIVTQEQVDSGEVPIIAPKGFMDHTISENIYAGNAMNRRLFYQYGLKLKAGPKGHVDQAIGKGVSSGNIGLIPPTIEIDQPSQELVIDGVRMIFQNTPGTEAPVEMNTWFPELKAFWAAENITGTIHNIYTLRGAPVRDALAWSKYINTALYQFGQTAEVMFAAHSWPRWGNPRIQEVMRGQRDVYAHLNNQVMHLANQGVTINEIHNQYTPPKTQQKNWYARGYHGSFEHNSRAVINRYLGYWDANPATLIPLSPSDSAPLYVEMMGGAKKIIRKASHLINDGHYFLALEILNKLVYAQPHNAQAKQLLADTFEQIAYQKESPSLRNSFLAAALELRQGIPQSASTRTAGPDMIRAMSVSMYLDYLAISMDARKAEGLAFNINLIISNTGERYAIELSNSALTNIQGFTPDDADLTITVSREDLEQVMMRQKKLSDLGSHDEAILVGNKTVLLQLESTLVEFNPFFKIMPGTE